MLSIPLSFLSLTLTFLISPFPSLLSFFAFTLLLLHFSSKTTTMTVLIKSKAHSPVKPAVHDIPAKAPATAPSPLVSPVEDNQDGTGVIGLDPWLEPYKGGLIHR